MKLQPGDYPLSFGGEDDITLKEWDILQKQLKNGYHMSKNDYSELIRLNHLVMERCHEIHNDSMRNL